MKNIKLQFDGENLDLQTISFVSSKTIVNVTNKFQQWTI